ncbi:MAG: HetZ-related protein 2 [Cyanobacteria bacterium P01_E01_bin.6]
MTVVETFIQNWQSRLQTDCSKHPAESHESIIKWLLGDDIERYETMDIKALKIAEQAMDYRYRILQQRYLGTPQQRAYQQLIQRLGSLFLIRSKVRTWVALSRDRRRTVVDVIQEVIQEMLQSDRHIQGQIRWIGECTNNPRLRNALMLTSIEEYCLRPIRNQPLLVYRFVNYLRRSQRGGMTQVPSGDLIRLVSEEIVLDDSDNPVSLLDDEAISQYQDQQAVEEQQALRTTVKGEFLSYLEDNVGSEAAQWLELHLQGQTQEAIAQTMEMPIKQVYRLREKISYHAIRVFGLKNKPTMVMSWLGTSLDEHSLGLTSTQWNEFWQNLSPIQCHIITKLKAGKEIEAIAQDLNMKSAQVLSEWSKLYLAAQEIRSSA